MRMSAVGDNCVDRYIDEGIAFPGGSCANSAVFARRIGLESSYIGVIGSDESGALIRQALSSEGVDISHVIDADEPSSITDIRVEGGNRLFTGHVPAQTPISLGPADLGHLAGSGWIHTGHSSGTESLLPELQQIAPVMFDFSNRDFTFAKEKLPHISVAAFSRENADDDECESLLRATLACGPRIALVTRGPGGAMALVDGVIHRCAAESIEVVDTMGAGDAFQTLFMAGLTAGKDLPEVMLRATRFAAEVCGHRGAFGHETPMTGKAG